MHRTIEIEEDVYAHILRHAELIGETASSILRRLLGISPIDPKNPSASRQAEAVTSNLGQELREFIRSPNYLAHGTASKRYLQILGHLHRQKPELFENIISIPHGRTRVYFARSKEEIEMSGTSTNPKPIPGSSFWAMTNSDTNQKREDLTKVLITLGYSSDVFNEATETIV